MTEDEMEREFITRFFDFHISNNTPPMAYLTWKTLQKTPALMTNDQLDGLDWDTITGLFDSVGSVKMTHVDTPTVTGSWVAREDYDPFCPDKAVVHNQALALFLSPNMEPLIEPDHPNMKNFVFSAVVVFKPATQNTCNVITGVTRLLEYYDKGEPAMALVTLSEKADYFPYPEEKDRVDYAVVPADNLHTRSVGPTSSFMFGRLIRANIGGVTHVVLPPAFGKDTENINFDWVPCPVRGSVWANTELIDTQDNNLMHEVEVGPDDVFRPDPEDKIRHSALGLRLVPLSDVTYLHNLEDLGYEKALEFMARIRSVDATPGSGAPGGPEDDPDNDAVPQGKATNKCRQKSSTKEPESTGPSLDVTDETRDTIDLHEVGAGEAAEEVDNTVLAEGDELQDDTTSDNLTPNEVRELLHSLMRKSTILNECRVCIRATVSKVVAKHTMAMFKPFTGYIEDMGHEVSTWHAGILSICPKMVNCNYKVYRENLGLIHEKTNAFYEHARVLNKSLDKNTAPKPAVKHDGDDGASGSDVGDIEDPFLAEIPNIMTDVKDSVAKYADEMAKKVLEYTGGANISSYLGHIFSTGLNFQTSMWQLITLQAVYVPTIMREHLCHEASTLRLFVECLAMLSSCAIPPPPLPISPVTNSIKALSAPATKISRSLPLSATGSVQAVPACSASQGPSTTSQGSATTSQGPALTPWVKPVVTSCYQQCFR